MYKLIKVLFLALLILGCEQVTDSQAPTLEGEWLVPKDEVFDGGPGQDGIPALLNPWFDNQKNIIYMNDDDLIIAVKKDGIVKGYPHPILDWHEIVNDQINSNVFAVTYCPLTGSALGWKRVIKGKTTTFGVSGLLYNSNLIPYDRLTGSRWSQMLELSINGELIGSKPETFQVLEMTWQAFQSIYPDAKVIQENTGYSRNYGLYPYGNYKDDNSLLFPISPIDDRLPRKERVIGVVSGGVAKAYRLDETSDGPDVMIDTLNTIELIVVRDSEAKFGAIFLNNLNGNKLSNFVAVKDSLPVVMRDDKGNYYDLFGEVVSGIDTGKRLEWIDSYIAYWVAWAGFHPNTQIYGN